jgi:hypothetical protein
VSPAIRSPLMRSIWTPSPGFLTSAMGDHPKYSAILS